MNTLKAGESLEILLYNPISTDDLPWIVGWTNIVSGTTTATGSTANGVTNEGTAVEMIPAPTTGINQLTGLSVFNSSVNPYVVQIHKKISSNPVIIGRWTLAPGESLVYTDKTGFANNSTSAIIGTDEKVKYDVGDATAGYLTAKLAAAGTDTVDVADTFNFYQVASAILKKITWANIVATIRTAFFGSTSGILKANGSGVISAASAGSDYQAALTFGIADTNKVQINAADVADNDYAKFTTTGLEGRSYSEVLSDIGGQAALTFGIADTNALKVDDADASVGQFCKFTANGIEGVAAPSGTDEKVKFDAADPTAGYLGAKIVAGTNITVEEGTGGDENKVKISSTAAGADEKVKYAADDASADYLGVKIVAGTGISLAEGTGGNADKLVITNSSPAQAGSAVIQLACSDEDSDLVAGTAVITFRMPYAFTLSAVRASVDTAPTGSTIIVDINEGGTSILSTKLSIDAGEKTSTTATSAAVISDTALADDSEITIDIDQIGSTIAGQGLKIVLIGS